MAIWAVILQLFVYFKSLLLLFCQYQFQFVFQCQIHSLWNRNECRILKFEFFRGPYSRKSTYFLYGWSHISTKFAKELGIWTSIVITLWNNTFMKKGKYILLIDSVIFKSFWTNVNKTGQSVDQHEKNVDYF